MPTTTTGLFFLRKAHFAKATEDAQGFRLTLRVLDRQGPHAAEPYVVAWRGEEARTWWAAHGAQLKAGMPLQLQLLNPRSIPGPQGPETHATVAQLALAPVAPSWQHAVAAVA